VKYIVMPQRAVGVEAFRQVVPEHIAYMEELHRSGILIAGGPFQDGLGGMLLIEASDEAMAHAIAAADPFITRGVERYTLRAWEVLTPVAPGLLTRDG
jgi:hypothetical protein